MKIAFDLDGVLKNISLAALKTSQLLGDFSPIRLYRTTEGYPLLNPAMISLPSDELYVITNCSSSESAREKKRWVQHFYGDKINFHWISLSLDKWGKEYVDPVARAKLDKMYHLQIDAYFDDDPSVIRVMREYNEVDLKPPGKMFSKKIVFFKWGPWIEEVY